MTRSRVLKNVDMITIASREKGSIGFIRIEIGTLYSKEDEDLINNLITQYPPADYKYMFIADNCFYCENENNLYEKRSKTKIEVLGAYTFEIKATCESGACNVSVSLLKSSNK